MFRTNDFYDILLCLVSDCTQIKTLNVFIIPLPIIFCVVILVFSVIRKFENIS